MKFEEKIQKISEKSQSRIERVAIILGVSLLIVSSISYFAIEAYGQLDVACPKDAYYGFDNQGNTVCRDIETNKILESESAVIVDSDSEKITKSEPWIITDSETGEITLNEGQVPIFEIILFGIIGVGAFIVFNAKNKNFKIFQRTGWSGFEKEQVRERQYVKCNMCYTRASKWKYDHIDGNKKNNDLMNCQALCPDCYSVKSERDSRLIYQ